MSGNEISKRRTKRSRRAFIKKGALVSSGFTFGTASLSSRVRGDNACDCGATASASITTQQDSSTAQFPVTASTEASHVKSADLGSEYQHVYRFDSTFTTTDGSGNQTSMIGQHRFRWDASNADSNVDCYYDNESPRIGACPDPSGGDSSTPEQIFEDIIEATVSAVNTTAGVAIAANSIISDIVNYVSDFNPGSEQKQWKWTYGNLNHQEKANHQLDPGFRHSSSTSPSWHIESMAEEYGNRITFYGGSSSIAEPTSSVSTSQDTTVSTQDNGGEKRMVTRTPGLKAEDFHALPSTTSMTKRERKTFGVRKPTQEERAYFESRGEDVVNIVERFPMTLVAEGVTK